MDMEDRKVGMDDRKVDMIFNNRCWKESSLYRRAIRWSFCGSRNLQDQLRADLPEEWDEAEGLGIPFACRIDKHTLDKLSGMHGESDDPLFGDANGNCAIM